MCQLVDSFHLWFPMRSLATSLAITTVDTTGNIQVRHSKCKDGVTLQPGEFACSICVIAASSLIDGIIKHVNRVDGLNLLEAHDSGDDTLIVAAKAQMLNRDFVKLNLTSSASEWSRMRPVELRAKRKRQLECMTIKACDRLSLIPALAICK